MRSAPARAAVVAAAVGVGGTEVRAQTLQSTTTFASGFNFPDALAFDTAGNLYVSNGNSNTVSKINSTGTVVSLSFASGFNGPYAMAFDTAGNLYVANANTVAKVNASGTTVNASFASGFNNVSGLAFDTAGNLYVSNRNSNTVSKVNSAGITVSASFAAGLNGPSGLAFDTAGNLYVSNPAGGTVSKVTPGGAVSTFASGLHGGGAIAFDTAGNLYVTSGGINAISQVTPNGTVSTFASGFNSASGLAFDSAGNLYVANGGTNTVIKLTITGYPVANTNTSNPSSAPTVTAVLPVITSPLTYTSTANLPFSYTIQASNTPTSYNAVAASSAGFPPGLFINTATGGITGTPTAAGTWPLTISASNAAGTATATLVVTINSGVPVITSPLTYSSAVNQPFSYTITGSNSPSSYNVTNTPGSSFPPGLGINPSTGGITGTPTVAGTYTDTISATNALGTGSATLTVTITSASSTSSTIPLTSQTISFPAVANVAATAVPFALSATASSGLPITYTVLSGPATISGNTVTLTGSAGTVTIEADQPGNGVYAAASSATISFQVTAAPPLLVNLSARSVVTPGAPITAGFVISGTTAKTVVLRGVGPALSSFGLSPALAHPQLTLLSASGTVVATNTGWGGTSTLSTAFTSVGAFPLATTSADSALTATLQPGAYTLTVSDAANDSGGLALAELYDASVDPTGLTQKLINLSSRGQVGAGNGVLVCGFVVSGATSKNLLIRGVGPSLAPYGLMGLLADPVLNVYNSAGALVATNNDWGSPVAVNASQTPATAATLTATAAQIGAFPLIAGSKDAAVIISLPPGSYTAQVSGNGGTTGLGLAEVYELPQ